MANEIAAIEDRTAALETSKRPRPHRPRAA